VGLSSFVIHSGRTYSPTLPLGVVSFLFILESTPRHVPLDNYFPPLSYSLCLFSTLLMYLLNIFILHSSGSIPYLTSSQKFLDSPQ
jgi:hypothetical protein